MVQYLRYEYRTHTRYEYYTILEYPAGGNCYGSKQVCFSILAVWLTFEQRVYALTLYVSLVLLAYLVCGFKDRQ